MLSSASTESNASAQHYEVRGVVRSVDAANLSLRIAHEEIPDYMPAMTMPFNVRSRELLSDLNRLGSEPAIRKLAFDAGLGQLDSPIVLPAR